MSTPPLPPGLEATSENDVANRLHSVAIHLLRRARVVDRETGLSPERLSLLSILVYVGPRTLSQLADAEQVSRPAVSRSVKALVHDGLVRRERNTTDRRSVTVYATPSGQRLMEGARKQRLQRIAADFGDLDRDQLAALRQAADILDSLASTPPKKGTQ